MVDEEEEEWALSEASSRRSYSDVIRDGSPSPAREASPVILQQGGASSSRPPPARRIASVVSRPEASRAAGGGVQRGPGGRGGPQPKRQRHRGPLPSFAVPAGVPAGFAGLCFKHAEPGHVAGMCEGATPLPQLQERGSCGPVPACQRLGPREGSSPPAPRHSVQDRLGDRGTRRGVEPPAEGPSAPSGSGAPVGETPYERSLCLEREIRAAPPLRQDERARGLTLLVREVRREQELRATALSSVVGLPSSTARRLDTVVVAEVEAARPARERGIIYRTPEVEGAERALRWGMVAFVSSMRRSVSCAAASTAILERFPVLEGHFSVHGFWPADLLLLQETCRSFRYRVHLEVVDVPPIAWNLDTAKTILGSFGWVERLGTETASPADLGTFYIKAWTDNLASLPLSKQLWLAKPLQFGDEDDDLLLSVEALIPEEVVLLEFDTTVHLVWVEDTAVSAGCPSPSGAPGPGPDGGSSGDDADGGLGRLVVRRLLRLLAGGE
ncbi:hypothetical protein ACQ4PT_024347 [Festuca glaucescens]